jgi:hypothetical protein
LYEKEMAAEAASIPPTNQVTEPKEMAAEAAPSPITNLGTEFNTGDTSDPAATKSEDPKDASKATNLAL